MFFYGSGRRQELAEEINDESREISAQIAELSEES